MTSDVNKVLRRACARFKTGVRKTFVLNGETMVLEPAGYHMDPDVGDDAKSSYWCEAELVVQGGRSNALDGSRSVVRIPLTEVTVEAVWTAYLQSQVDAVHAL